ncbi:N-acetylmuramoyl-L-alanine amidase [Novilysobacter spongiicola]|uniref:N-acetylmuramoyl-L-alanine amidase AmiC n=1 Tax=Lysobacter spongiicola DSM 21749 TaxID=1122188 RepID=A0A1T4MQH4_9GAMM|nr:N-acetylmuramoyl-L-alanine amidase [Lysobacter spongiicola]SJZ69213.1 N-acetylmuramoyl-L-alanine amidase [Lysobacter spongiicola DSM 21749]
MRADRAILQTFILGLALLVGLLTGVSKANEIKGLTVSSGATGTRAEIALAEAGDFNIIKLSGPDRLVVDLAGTSIAGGVQVPSGAGVVSRVRTGQPVPGTARVVFDLGETVAPLQPRIEQGASGPKLVVEWPDDGAARLATENTGATATPAPAPATSADPIDQAAASSEATSRLISEIAARAMAQQPAAASTGSAAQVSLPPVPTTVATGVPTPAPGAAPAREQPAATPAKTLQQVMQGTPMRPLVIAIDPGHGGQDPGAIGKSGTREKDVVLEISRELARQINATPGMRAYLTRDRDVFIPLNKRASLARSAGADMFISIHADAAENRAADGSSVYVLSLKGASSQRARWLANKENAADLVGGARLPQNNDTLTSVLLDLTQSGNMKASEEAAGEILDGLKRVGNIHKPQIERANFAVLRTSDIPAMLVETAFISNPEEERRLQDPGFRRKVAGAVLDGINTFFTRQPPPGTLYAARAATGGGAAGAAGGSP